MASGNLLDGERQFLQEVFPQELEKISQRREVLGVDPPAEADGPSSARGLVGLALSGGGIRSATFCLGVIQALAKHKVLKTADYLSTVSGGGYIGSCLSTLMNDPEAKPEGERFPFHKDIGVDEPQAVVHLRNSSNYLAPGGLLDTLRIPALLLRGILLNFLVFLPWIMTAVLTTEFAYEMSLDGSSGLRLLAYLPFLALVLLFQPVGLLTRALKLKIAWDQRNRFERLFSGLLLLSLGVFFLLGVIYPLVGLAIDTSWDKATGWLFKGNAFSGVHTGKWIAVIGVVLAFMVALKASALVGRLTLFVMGLLGPGLLMGVYLLLCVWQIQSPHIEPAFKKELDEGAKANNALLWEEINKRREIGYIQAVTKIDSVPSASWRVDYQPVERNYWGPGIDLDGKRIFDWWPRSHTRV